MPMKINSPILNSYLDSVVLHQLCDFPTSNILVLNLLKFSRH